MFLSNSEKQRQRELKALGWTGRTNGELHNLNVKENATKSNAELFREAEKHGPNSKAANALRNRGINYP